MMKRTGIPIDKIEHLLSLNEEVRQYLKEKYPKEQIVNWYVAGLKEEYIRLLFRLPEGVKNIDLDCVEISSAKGIIAFLEFKRGLLIDPEKRSPYGKKQNICTYAGKCVLTELEKSTGKPGYVLRFNDAFQKFQIFRITDNTHNYNEFTLNEIWEWRRSLLEGPCLPVSTNEPPQFLVDYLRKDLEGEATDA